MRRTRVLRLRCFSAAALILVAAAVPGSASGSAAARSTARGRPAKGRVLVATRQVHGPIFDETVVLLLSHGPEGALGLIVNRPLEVRLSELLPEVAELEGTSDVAHFGGPVEPNRMLILIQASTPPPGSQPVVDDLHTSTDLATLRALVRETRPGVRFRAYVGYAGWGAGQLEAELDRGDWNVDSASAATLFESDPADLWRELNRRNSGIEARAPGGRDPSASASPGEGGRWASLGAPQVSGATAR